MIDKQRSLRKGLTDLLEDVDTSKDQHITLADYNSWMKRATELMMEFNANEEELKQPSAALDDSKYLLEKLKEEVISIHGNILDFLENIRKEYNFKIAQTEEVGVNLKSRRSNYSLSFKSALGDYEEIIEDFNNNLINFEEVIKIHNETRIEFRRYLQEEGENDLTNYYYELKERYKDLINNKEMNTASVDFILPAIEIPNFSGNLTEWTAFKELFNQVVAKQKKYSNVEKFLFLKTKLTGPAALLVENLPLDDVSFTIAMDRLEKRFNNKRVLSNIYFQDLLNDSFVISTKYSVESFRNKVEKHLQDLKSLQLSDKEVLDSLINYILISKLDSDLKYQYESSIENYKDIQSLDPLLNFLDKQIHVLHICEESSDISLNRANNCRMGCIDYHPLYECFRFKNLSLRNKWKNVRKKKFCSKCLSKDHKTYACPENNCNICGRKHHLLLHRYDKSSGSRSDSDTKIGFVAVKSLRNLKTETEYNNSKKQNLRNVTSKSGVNVFSCKEVKSLFKNNSSHKKNCKKTQIIEKNNIIDESNISKMQKCLKSINNMLNVVIKNNPKMKGFIRPLRGRQFISKNVSPNQCSCNNMQKGENYQEYSW